MKNLFIFTIFLLFFTGPVVYAVEPLKIYAPPSTWAQIDGRILTGPIVDVVVELDPLPKNLRAS